MRKHIYLPTVFSSLQVETKWLNRAVCDWGMLLSGEESFIQQCLTQKWEEVQITVIAPDWTALTAPLLYTTIILDHPWLSLIFVSVFKWQ